MIRNAEFASDDQVRRFQNEAKAVATLDHSGIVPIYEVGTYEDQRYFSMKLVDGEGLDRKLEELSKDPRAAARLVAEVADAVYHALQQGILHRDLKPANILVDAQGQAHVTDFGLAKRIEEDAGLTVSGAIMGTLLLLQHESEALLRRSHNPNKSQGLRPSRAEHVSEMRSCRNYTAKDDREFLGFFRCLAQPGLKVCAVVLHGGTSIGAVVNAPDGLRRVRPGGNPVRRYSPDGPRSQAIRW